MTRSRRFDLIAFDWDGTLFDSTALIVRCIQRAAQDLQLPVPSDQEAAFVIGLGLHEAFESAHGRPARSFPAVLPLLQLDRIYVRGFEIQDARVHHGHPWARISDHAALTSTLKRS